MRYTNSEYIASATNQQADIDCSKYNGKLKLRSETETSFAGKQLVEG